MGVRISVGGDWAVKLRLIKFLTAFLLGVFWVGAFIFGVGAAVWVLSKYFNLVPQAKNLHNRL